VVVEDAGHVPIWDAPDALAEILLERIGDTVERHVPALLRRSASSEHHHDLTGQY
jgi:hypothetical protein